MIHYILQGPAYSLEIHDDKLRLVKRSWTKIFSKKSENPTWEIKELCQFEIMTPKFLMISGKLQWSTFNGELGHFRYSTNSQMVKKIEAYMQKQILKNLANQEIMLEKKHKKLAA